MLRFIGNDAKDTSIQSDTSDKDKSKPEKRKVNTFVTLAILNAECVFIFEYFEFLSVSLCIARLQIEP